MTGRPTLDELGRKYGVDKASTVELSWQWPVDYLNTYDELFTPLRDEPIQLLELGWGEWDPELQSHANPNVGGRSARMWRDYFPHADIHIVDIEPKVNTVLGVSLWRGDQTDKRFLDDLSEKHGPWDIIVDDASHISSKTIASLEALWPHLAPHGYYCIEDLHQAYHDYYFGRHEADRNPNTTRRTAMNYLKRLADDVNYRGERLKGPAVDGDPRSWDCYPKRYWLGHRIDWIMFRYQLCVIRKADG